MARLYPRIVLAATVVVLALGGSAAGQGDIDDLGPVPPDCGAVGKDFTDPSCTTQTRNGTFTLSPHVVHAGGTLTGTVSAGCQHGQPPSPCPVTWPDVQATPSLAFNQSLKPEHGCHDTDYTCTWKVSKTAETQKYTIMTVGITSDQGTGISKDYYAIIGKGFFELAGHLKDEAKHPLAGVRVHISGPRSLTLTTDTTGQYSAVLKKGRYTVTPQPKKGASTFAPVGSKDCAAQGASCVVNLIQDRSADFRADSSLHTELTFSPTSLPADGTSFGSMSVALTNAVGDPVSGRTVNISPPLGDPPFLICTGSGRSYPEDFPASGDVQGLSYNKKTDDAGHIDGTVVAGTTIGDFTTEASLPDAKKSDEFSFRTLSLTGSPGGPVQDTLADNIRTAVAAQRGTAGGYLALSNALSQTDANTAQSLLLDMLVRFRQDGSVPQLQFVDFAPIHSANGGVGILFYPHGAPRAQILKFGVNARVLDVGTLLQSSGGAVTFPADYPTLADWQNGGSLPHGQALAGHLTHVAGEELSYFGLPYPPPEGTVNHGGQLGRNTYDEQCTLPDRNLEAVTVHSPVSVVLSGAAGKVGTDAHGKPVTTGAGLVERNGDETTIVVPAGTYKIALSGTAAGPATLVFWGADGKPSVIAFRSRRGAKGSATLTAAGASGARFAGHRLGVAKGLGLRAHGLPRTLRGGRRTLRIVVRDQFGAAVPGALVTLSGAVQSSAATDRHGVARLRVTLPRRRGRLTATVRAAGFKTARLHARLRR